MMPNPDPLALRQLWRTLTAIPTLRAAKSEWKHELRDEWDNCADLFVPTDDFVTSWPDASGHRHEVFCHDRQDYVAVCPESGQRRPLTREDVRVWAFDVPRCVDRLRAAWEITTSGSQAPRLASCHFLGTETTRRRLTYLWLPTSPANPSDDISLIRDFRQSMYWILFPTEAMIPESLRNCPEMEPFVLDGSLVATDGTKWCPIAPRTFPEGPVVRAVSDHGVNLLRAMHAKKLFEYESRIKASAIVLQAYGSQENPESFKREFAKLVHGGWCFSEKRAQQSGYWLSNKGRAFVENNYHSS